MGHSGGVISVPRPIGVKEIEKADSTPQTPTFVILSAAKDLCFRSSKPSNRGASPAAQNDEKGNWWVFSRVSAMGVSTLQ